MKHIFVNLTPHSITLKRNGEVITINPCDRVVRIDMAEKITKYLNGIPISTRKAKGVTGLPDPHPYVIYLVSSMVLDAVDDTRVDVLAPDTGPTAIRDNKGRIQAVTQLVSK